MKRILTIVLVLVIMASNVFAQNEVDAEVLKVLAGYEIMQGDPDGDLRLDEGITRAEMAKIIVFSMGVEVAENPANKFDDIDYSHWAKDYINIVCQNKIIEIEDKNFNPEEIITNQEAVKMIVNMHGYGPMAESRGGYPQGYITTAMQLGIIKGLNLKFEETALRGDVALMINAALDVPLMQQTGFGDAIEYSIFDGKSEDTPLVTLRTQLDLKYKILY